MTLLDNSTRRFIGALRDNPEFKDEALKYGREIERYVAELELETFHQQVKIGQLLTEIGIYVDILKSYGVDIGKLGSRSIFSLKEQIQAAEKGMLSIPENLISHKKR